MASVRVMEMRARIIEIAGEVAESMHNQIEQKVPGDDSTTAVVNPEAFVKSARDLRQHANELEALAQFGFISPREHLTIQAVKLDLNEILGRIDAGASVNADFRGLLHPRGSAIKTAAVPLRQMANLLKLGESIAAYES